MNLIEMLDKIKEQLPEGVIVDFNTASRDIEFTAFKNQDAITFVSRGGHSIPVKWPEFQQVLSLLLSHPEGVLAGDAQNSNERTVGIGKCKLDTIEGHISHYVYGKTIGDKAEQRRATYIMPVLIKANLVTYENSTFKLK